jgi:exopolyphosphatase/guanosine-5'-triphosphate,3'-diphosphate pyrophosphatase
MDYADREKIKGINAKRAEIIVAGSQVFAAVMREVGLAGFKFLPYGLRDGLLAQMAAEFDAKSASHLQIEADRKDTLERLLKKYQVDRKYASKVRDLALQLFDQLKSVHGLHQDYREWIGAAALLIETGAFVNQAGRHRHTYYVVSHSELFGFSKLARQAIAVIARYQGNSRAQVDDAIMRGLPSPVRLDVLKAIAVLRLAKALNQSRQSHVISVKVKARGHQVRLEFRSKGSIDLERWAVDKESNYLREVFGREFALPSS